MASAGWAQGETEPEGSRLEEKGEAEEGQSDQEEDTGQIILFFGRRVFVRGGCLEYPIPVEDAESYVICVWIPGLNGVQWTFGRVDT
jgi:hypothetical protein